MSLCEDEELVRGKSEVAGEGLTQANTQRSEPTTVKTLQSVRVCVWLYCLTPCDLCHFIPLFSYTFDQGC